MQALDILFQVISTFYVHFSVWKDQLFDERSTFWLKSRTGICSEYMFSSDKRIFALQQETEVVIGIYHLVHWGWYKYSIKTPRLMRSASESIENTEEMFPQYYMDSDAIKKYFSSRNWNN